MNEDDKWQQPIGFLDFVGGFNNPQATQAIINLNEQAARERYIQQQLDKQKNSEVVRIHTPEGKTQTSTQVIGMSGTDPVGQFIVESVALGKPLAWAGKGALYGLARYGAGKPQNWARATLFSKELNSAAPKIKPVGLQNSSSVKFERDPYIYEGPDGMEHIQTPTQRFWEKVPKDLIITKRASEARPGSALYNAAQQSDFSPKVAARVGQFNEMYSEETINRLKDLGYDVEASIPMYYKGVRTKVVPSTYIRKNAKKPVYLGLYNKEGISGTYHGSEDIAFADPTLSSNLDGTIFHERIMHGTDGLLDTYSSIQPEAKQMYQDFINKLFYVEHDNPNYPGTTIRDWAPGVISNGSDLQVDFGNNMIFNIIDGTNTWYEGRATINELKRRYLHDLWLKAGKPKTLEKVRPNYLEKIDGLTEQELLGDLANKIGGYGQTYVALRKNNPNFIPDLKYLLKHGAMYGAPTAVGAKTFYNIQQKKSGGKLISRNTIQNFKNKRL